MRCRAFIQSSGLNAILRLDAFLRTVLALQRNPGIRAVALVLVQMLVLALLRRRRYGRFAPTLPALLAAGPGFFGWRRFKAGK